MCGARARGGGGGTGSGGAGGGGGGGSGAATIVGAGTATFTCGARLGTTIVTTCAGWEHVYANVAAVAPAPSTHASTKALRIRGRGRVQSVIPPRQLQRRCQR